MAELSPYDMAADGLALKTARKYAKLADVFFGSTDSPRLQRESVALAEERGLSMERLQMIDSHAQKLKKKRGAAWKLRAELIAHEGTYEEVNALGNQRVDELVGDKPKEPGMRISRPKNGMVTMSITDTQRHIIDFEKTLDAIETSSEPRSKALLEAFWNTSTAAVVFSNPNTALLSPLVWINPQRLFAAKATNPSSAPPTARQ